MEVVYYLRRSRGILPSAEPALGPCALSGFSEGGRPLASVVASSPDGRGFPELRELYLLDVVPPSGSSADAASYQHLMELLGRWWSGGAEERRVRFYSEFYPFSAPSPVRGDLVRSNAGAREFRAKNATCLYTPQTFWTTIGQEQADSRPDPGYAFGSGVHQLMPCVFLEHALENSGLPPV